MLRRFHHRGHSSPICLARTDHDPEDDGMTDRFLEQCDKHAGSRAQKRRAMSAIVASSVGSTDFPSSSRPSITPSPSAAIGRRHYAGIFLLCLGTLLLELSLTRVMSVALWYHFGFLVISTALLGFGASGVTLALWRRLREDIALDRALAVLSLLFGVLAVVCFWLLQRIPFDPFNLLNDARQFWLMPLYFLDGRAAVLLRRARARAALHARLGRGEPALRVRSARRGPRLRRDRAGDAALRRRGFRRHRGGHQPRRGRGLRLAAGAARGARRRDARGGRRGAGVFREHACCRSRSRRTSAPRRARRPIRSGIPFRASTSSRLRRAATRPYNRIVFVFDAGTAFTGMRDLRPDFRTVRRADDGAARLRFAGRLSRAHKAQRVDHRLGLRQPGARRGAVRRGSDHGDRSQPDHQRRHHRAGSRIAGADSSTSPGSSSSRPRAAASCDARASTTTRSSRCTRSATPRSPPARSR